MRRGVFQSEEKLWRRHHNNEGYSLGDIDLLNLRLNAPSEKNVSSIKYNREYEKGSTRDFSHPNRNLRQDRSHHTCKTPRGYENKSQVLKSFIRNISSDEEDIVLIYSKDGSKKIIKTEPINQNDFLYPSSKKKKTNLYKSGDFFDFEKSPERICSRTNSNDHFPFKLTPSGKLKVESSQVVFSSKKLSVLVADPQNTKVNISPEIISSTKPSSIEMTHHEFTKSPPSPMETLISQAGGFSSLGSIIGNSPVRGPTKESSEYQGKETNEILDPELNLNRLGYTRSDPINWDKIKLPNKLNLYLELYRRITNNINADCKVYIDNEEFNCHLIVLQCYSELFAAYVAVKKVELPSDKCSISAFALIYNWMITGEPSYIQLNRENVLDVFISAKYLKIKDLVEQCWSFIDNVEVFNEETAFLLYMDAKRRNLEEVKELMLPRIQQFFLMLVSSQDWLELDVDDVINLLKSNYVAINCEMEIFMSAVRWLKYDYENRHHYKFKVIGCVRFGNIAPWQLVDIKRNPDNPDFIELAKDTTICKMIDDGQAYVIIKYWYGQENNDFQHWNTALGLQEPAARNWNGPDKTYFSYREFIIYLDQYRRNQLIEKNKPKLPEKLEKIKVMEAGKFISENKNSPRIPTMEEFMTKKKLSPCRKK